MRRWSVRVALASSLLGLALPALRASAVRDGVFGPTASVLTQHNDTNRTGANLDETRLTTANVNVASFGMLFTRPVDGQIYAQPLYVPGLVMPDGRRHNVVFVATMRNSVYAFDADDPAAASPLWKVTLGPPIPLPNTADPTFGDSDGYFTAYPDISQAIGIVSTPVIDLAARAIYVVTTTDSANHYHHYLHALDLATGAEKFGGPRLIRASFQGSGYDTGYGTVTFVDRQQLQRPGLLLANGIVYIGFGSYAGTDPYHGWLLGYNAHTLEQVAVFVDTPDGAEGGIWQAGAAPATDAAGNVYVGTGNGSWDAGSGGRDYGQSYLKLSQGLVLLDWFTPYNQAFLRANDLDAGTSGIIAIPGTDLLVSEGKHGVMYLIDRSNMGHFHAGRDSQIVQSFQATLGHSGDIAYWNGPGGPYIYSWGENDHLKAYRFAHGRVVTTPASESSMVAPAGRLGAILSLSAHGNAPGSGILWASHAMQGDANHTLVPGILQAFDATDVHKELWDSQQDAARDAVGNFAKFNPPTIANGKVYLGTCSGYLAVYGLFPAGMR